MTYREPTILDKKCGQRLNEAIKVIATREQLKLNYLDDQFGLLCGVAAKTFERYRYGGSRPEERSIEIIVAQLVKRADVTEGWIERFLHYASYPGAKRTPLISRFFGSNREQDQLASINFSPIERGNEIEELQIRQALHLASQAGFCYNNPSQLNILNSTHDRILQIIVWLYQNKQDDRVIQLANDVSYYFYVKGLWPRRIYISEMAANAARRIGNFEQEINALAYLVQTLSRQGKQLKAEPHVARLRQLQDSSLIATDIQVEMKSAIALYAIRQGDFNTAKVALTSAIESAERDAVLPAKAIIAHRILGEAMYQQGDLVTAETLFQDVLNRATDIGQARAAALALLNLSAIRIDMGNLEEAEILLQHGTEQARNNLDPWCMAEAYKLWARLHIEEENLDQAVIPLLQAKEGFIQLGMLLEHAEVEVLLRRCMS